MLVNKKLKHFMTTKYNIIKYFYLMLICDHSFSKYIINEQHHLKFEHLENMIHKKTLANLGASSKQTNLGVFFLPRYFFPFTVEQTTSVTFINFRKNSQHTVYTKFWG